MPDHYAVHLELTEYCMSTVTETQFLKKLIYSSLQILRGKAIRSFILYVSLLWISDLELKGAEEKCLYLIIK